jgi:hypothetical protein
MEPKKCYYIAGGRTLDAINAYCAAQPPHTAYMRKLADELGSANMYGRDSVRLFSIPSTGIPKGWCKANQSGTMRPRADKSGKEWRARILAAPPIVTARATMERAGMQMVHQFREGYFFESQIGWAFYGDTTVAHTIQLPDGSSLGGDPLDSERIPDSRYWKIKEDAAVSKVV